MYYDTLTMAAVRDQIAAELLGGRIQRVVQPADLSIGLEIYSGSRQQLLMSADAQAAAVMVASLKPRRGVERPSPLWLLLAKYVRGARLVSAEQAGLDRVLMLGFAGEEGSVTLVCEVMGRYSNIILLDSQGLVMDALKRIPSSLNRYRVTLPHHDYVLPPPQDKADPRSLEPAALGAALASRDEPLLWRRIVGAVGGVSPILAREVAYRAAGQADAPASVLGNPALASEVARVLGELFALPANHAWEPCVASDAAGGPPVAWAPYPLRHYAHWEPATTVSAAIEAVLAARDALDPYGQARDRLRGMIAEQTDRQNGRLASLRVSLVPEREIADLQARGNAILAMAWAIHPGQREVRVDPVLLGGDAECEPVPIALDPALSPSANAQELFARARKRQAAGEQVPALIAESERELDYMRQLLTDVDLAADRPALDQVEDALREAGCAAVEPHIRKRPAAVHPLSVHCPDGGTILVGRNSRENDTVTFRLGAAGDTWLHAHGVPGAHVIIRAGSAEVGEEALLQAAILAARYSAARQANRVLVDYTERRYVRHIPGGRPGMVTYSHERTMTVSPGQPADADEPD